MLKKVLCLFIGTLCGFGLTILIKIPNPFRFGELISEFVISPVKFFISMILFMVGFLCLSNLVKGAIEQTYFLMTRRGYRLNEMVISYCVILSFLILLLVGFWHALFLIAFALVYGIISLDFQKQRNVYYEVNR